MNSSVSSVLIVGAGPSGLALALSLLQNGVAVRIIDKLSRPKPRALELYKLLGVTEVLTKAGPFRPVVHHKTPMGAGPPRVLSSASLRKPTPDIPFPNLVLIGQDIAEKALRSHMEKYYATFVELGTSLQKFEQHDEYVKVQLLKSEDGVDREEVLKVRWLIGADGPKSTVRKQAGLTFLGETRDDHRFISGDLHIHGDLDRKIAHRWGPSIGNGIGLQPSERLDDTLFQFIIGGPDVPFDTLLSDHGKLLDYISNGVGQSKLAFGELILVDDWRPNTRMANKFSERRIFLVGDAAHIHYTTGGQGIVSCLQDSVNLGWKLALVERGLSSRRLLATYDEERRPVISDMLRITTDLFDCAMAGKPWPPPPSLSLLRQFGVNYRRSSIVLDDTLDTPWTDENYVGTYGACGCIVQAGDRAPDAPGLIGMEELGETSVFKILTSSRHIVFVLAGSVEAASPFFDVISDSPKSVFEYVLILSASSSPPTRLLPCVRMLRDRDGHAFRHYSVKEEPRAIVVRPDGMIGALVNNPKSLERYLDLIFIKRVGDPLWHM